MADSTLYRVDRPDGTLVLIAPIPTLQVLLDLHKEAVARVEREGNEPAGCHLYFTRQRTLGERLVVKRWN